MVLQGWVWSELEKGREEEETLRQQKVNGFLALVFYPTTWMFYTQPLVACTIHKVLTCADKLVCRVLLWKAKRSTGISEGNLKIMVQICWKFPYHCFFCYRRWGWKWSATWINWANFSSSVPSELDLEKLPKTILICSSFEKILR